MELNINSPAYFTREYGVIDEIYKMCRELEAFVRPHTYSELINIVGITPIVAPIGETNIGRYKEVKQCKEKSGFASVSLRINYEYFTQSDMEVKKVLIIENIWQSIHAISKKAQIDMEAFTKDVISFCQAAQININPEEELKPRMKPKRRRIKLGDIFEIPLPDGTNAYGRLHKDTTLAIYNIRCKDVSELPEEENYESYIGVYKDLLQDGEWPVVANRSFALEEEAWPPPMVVVDAITQRGSLYYKGIIFPCSYEECKDLEVVAAWDRHHVVDRLMGIDIWEKSLRRPMPHNITFARGLTRDEISTIELRYNIHFPKSLRNFLMQALPVSNGFYNWRDSSAENVRYIKEAIARPMEALKELAEASKAPVLIPVYAHRYMPMVDTENPPILSVHGTDIIYYGENLLDYLDVEFGTKKQEDIAFDRIQPVPFWSEIMERF